MTKFESLNNCENALIKLERAENLFSLLFDEIDEAISASIKKDKIGMILCCERANISEALAVSIFANISEAKKLISIITNEVDNERNN